MVTFFSFLSPSLQKIKQLCFHGNLDKTPTWNNAHNTQTLCILAHNFCNFIVLQHGFVMLHHEGSEGVKEGQNFLAWLLHPILVYIILLCFKKLLHF